MRAAIVQNILSFLCTLKVYHWGTLSYPRHIASDTCFTTVQKLTDEFVEICIAKYGRVKVLATNKKQNIVVKRINDKQAIELLKEFIVFLEHLNLDPKKDNDLVNIRDELIATLNQTLYLFTLT